MLYFISTHFDNFQKLRHLKNFIFLFKFTFQEKILIFLRHCSPNICRSSTYVDIILKVTIRKQKIFFQKFQNIKLAFYNFQKS